MVYIASRANYSSYKPLMKSIISNNRLSLITILTGSAIIDKYGDLEPIIINDGFEINYKLHSIVEGANLSAMTLSVSLGIQTFASIIENEKPDILLLVGDRYEVLSASIVGLINNVFIAHTMGGELSGTVDEKIRHAITKIANIHFPATNEALARIISMGEHPKNVFNFGCPRIDYVKDVLNRSNKIGNELYKLEKGVGDFVDVTKDYIMVSQHPVTTEFGDAKHQMELTLSAVASFGIPLIILWPNSDAGSNDISKSIRLFKENNKLIPVHYFKNLEIDNYVRLLSQAKCLVGNSSSGLREGAYIGVPVVNIGSRQRSREHAINVLNVDYDYNEIVSAIDYQINHKYDSDYLYGDGNASDRIVDKLSDIDLEIEKLFYEK